MKLYEIDSQYMEYLYKADSKVLIHNSGNHQRKFIAIIREYIRRKFYFLIGEYRT